LPGESQKRPAGHLIYRNANMKYLMIVTCLLAFGCGKASDGDGAKKEEQNISPNQTISEEELHKKDSTNDANLTHENDTTVNNREQ
jgi:hypothetical protein